MERRPPWHLARTLQRRRRVMQVEKTPGDAGGERAEIFFGRSTREAIGETLFYGALKWWLPPSMPRIYQCGGGSPGDSHSIDLISLTSWHVAWLCAFIWSLPPQSVHDVGSVSCADHVVHGCHGGLPTILYFIL
jgi:hypothetical protein